MPNMDILTLKEGISAFLFLAGMLALCGYYYKKYLKEKSFGVLFLPALAVKILGGGLFVMIYLFLYQGGDTFDYYESITLFSELIRESPGRFWELMSASHGDSILPNRFGFTQLSTFFLIKLGTILSLISGNSYWVITFGFGFVSFWGAWALYINLSRLFPENQVLIGILIFFIPSVVVWSSGLLKDSIVMGLFCWICYGLINLLILRRKLLRSVLIILIATLLLSFTRVYPAFALVPALAFLVCHLIWQKLPGRMLKVVFVIGSLLLGIILLETIFDGMTEPLASYHKWQTEKALAQNAGSTYLLNPLEPGWAGVLKTLFGALGTTFLRPFPWEWSSVSIAISGIQSLALVAFCLWVLYTTSLRRIFQNLTQNPLIGFFMIYCLIYGFVIGLFSYNFGTLDRYRIAVWPFFLVAVLLLRRQPEKGFLD